MTTAAKTKTPQQYLLQDFLTGLSVHAEATY